MSKVILSEAIEQIREYFVERDGEEVTLKKEDVAGLISAFGEMTDYARELEVAMASRPALARAGLAASAITLGGNIIMFPIRPREHLPAI